MIGIPATCRALLGALLGTVVGAVIGLGAPTTVVAQAEGLVRYAPDRAEGEGPFDRLVIRGVNLIDGSGAPPRGPVDIVIEGNRITDVVSVGVPNVPVEVEGRPGGATREIDATGWYALPGFVDVHVHTGGVPKAPEAEYVYKLWLAHGITTTRGVGYGPLEWSLHERGRSARNEITAPRMFVYERPGQGWDQGPVHTPDQARAWVRWIAERGVDGMKLGVSGEPPEVMAALLEEGAAHGLGSTAHLAQLMVAGTDAREAARMGLGTLTHYYGLFEALYDGHDVQPWPDDMNYNDEQDRFGQVARQWSLIHPRDSPEWNALIEEFLELDLTLDPTMTAYLASRDVMRERTAEWHRTYTLPSLWEYYEPSRTNHGSYYYDWTTADETAWRNFYRVWMQFLDDYKDAGGRVTVSSDAGFIYNLFGFSTIEEMELLQEAGFHPLEVIRGATQHGAETLVSHTGRPIEFGVVRPGFLADLVLVKENPVHDLKVLYGTGAVRLNDETGRAERRGGVRYTIKDGIVYDARALLADVAAMVEAQKAERGITVLPDVPWAPGEEVPTGRR
jgi:imidazolonepropionase-like amidohydrolase